MTKEGILTGKTAVITGGGRGIGAAIAKDLALVGAQVVVCGRKLAPLHATVETIGKQGGKAVF